MDKDEILLSVIIPVFNEELTISNIINRVKSVLDSEDFSWEIAGKKTLDVYKRYL